MNVTTPSGDIQIPTVASSITLGGRQSKVIVTTYTFGSSLVSYSTAQIFYAGVIDGRDVLFLYGDSSQEHETELALTGTPNKMQSQSSLVTSSTGPAGTIVTFLSGIEGLVTVYDSDTQLILFADTQTAASFWSPVISGDANDPLKNFWDLGTNTSILVGGPYLVRSASITGSQLDLRGDLNTSAILTVIGPKTVKTITWNGETISEDATATSALTSSGGFVGQLKISSASTNGITVPRLGGWKFKDSLPEIAGNFDDGNWTVADHTTTNIPLKPYYGDGRILYGCDYGL